MVRSFNEIIHEKDDASFREYAIRCSRAFGPLIHMMDEPDDAPIPMEIKPSSYHKDQFAEACRAYYMVIGMRNDEAERLAQEDYINRLEDYAEHSREGEELAVKYGKMLVKVANWDSPGPDHDEFRDFMINQLEKGLQSDCGYIQDLPQKMNGQEFRSDLVERVKSLMDEHKREYAQDVWRAKVNNKWLQGLLNSLPSE